MVLATELIIVVMGVTGTGKSTFIKLLTGDESIRIDDSECCKLIILCFHLWISHYRFKVFLSSLVNDTNNNTIKALQRSRGTRLISLSMAKTMQ